MVASTPPPQCGERHSLARRPLVTADEALDDDENVELTMPDGRVAAATLAGRDPSTDIALLRVEPQRRPETVAPFEPALAVEAGHLAVAVGRAGNGEIAASGIVKECGGSWRSWAGGLIDRKICSTSRSIAERMAARWSMPRET